MRNQFIPNLRRLRALVTVFEYQSISRASEHLYLSQPAITQLISKLENELKVALFKRHSRGVLPTQAGETYVQRARSALTLLSLGTKNALKFSGQVLRHDDKRATRITTTHLQALIAVERAGNFSLAAAQSGVSQPALFRAARDLEKALEFKLFGKQMRGICLTPEAHILLRHVRLALAELRQGDLEIKALLGAHGGCLVIGSLPLVRHNVLPRAVLNFHQHYPDVAIRLLDELYDNLIAGLCQGEIDVIVGALRYPQPLAELEQEVLFEDALAIIARKDHPWAAKAQITLEDLGQCAWVLPAKNTPTRNYFTRLFADTAIKLPERIIETNSQILVRNLLLNSDRLALISAKQMAMEIDLNLVITLPYTLPENARRIGLTTRHDWRPTQMQRDFITCLRSACQVYRQ